MIRREITYTNYNGDKVTKAFYFSLSKIEIIESFVNEKNQSITDVIQNLADAGDFYSLVRVLKKLILSSYGEKSDDGERFVKSPELTDAFEQSAAFSELYTDLLTDTKKMIEFTNGILPADIRSTSAQIAEAVKNAEKTTAERAENRRKAIVEMNSEGEVVSETPELALVEDKES